VQHSLSSTTSPYGILNHKGWNNGYSLWMQGDQFACPSGARCVQFNLPGSTDSLKTQTTLTGSTWHHVVATYDGALMKVFIDGIQDSNTEPKTDDITAPSPPENDVWIGHGDMPYDQAWSAAWEGQIDEIRISNIARSQCWVETEYKNQNTPGTYVVPGTEVVVADVSLANHAAGQEADKFTSGSSVTGAELFAFKLTNNLSSGVTVDQLQFQLSGVSGVVQTDFANLAIYVDANNDGAIGGGETTAVGGTGVVSGGVTTITFGTDFTISASSTTSSRAM
jgi:hypothetical protein